MAKKDDIDFAAFMEPVARHLFGEPSKKHSKQGDMRFGTNGSMSVNPKEGRWFDHQEDEGGGVLGLIERETKLKGREAIDWLVEIGCDVPGWEVRDGGSTDEAHSAPHSNEPPPPDSVPDGPDYDHHADAAPDIDPEPDPEPEPERQPGKIVKTYDYTDADGNLKYQVCRMEPKEFRQRRPDKSEPSGWSWKIKGIRSLPYRLEEMIDDASLDLEIFLVEGEKDVDRLRALGIPATCNSGGAGKFPDSLLPWFEGVRVVLVPDDDPQSQRKDGRLLFHDDGRPKHAGQDHCDLVGQKLQGTAASVRIMHLPHATPHQKFDAADWLDADEGNTAEQWYELSSKAPEWTKPFASRFRAVQWKDLDAPGPEHEWLIKSMLTRHETGMLAGPSGSGKSFITLDLSLSIARGIPWFGHRTLKGGVVYQAGEGALGIKKRLRAYRQENNEAINDDLPFVLLPAQLDLHNDDKGKDNLIEEVRHWKDTFDVPLELVVIDTLSAATPGANENMSEDMSRVLARAQAIRDICDCSILLVHHMNADGNKVRGHTSITANVDSVITCNKIEGLSDNDDLAIREVHVMKQKDGEAGITHRFTLPEVTIGTDVDGDPITSCVIGRPNGGDFSPATENKPKHKRRRKNLQGNKALYWMGFVEVHNQFGVAPPQDVRGVPDGAKVVTEEQIAPVFVAKGSWEQGDEEKVAKAQTKACANYLGKLQTDGVLAKSGQWVWWTGYPVSGLDHPDGQRIDWGDDDEVDEDNPGGADEGPDQAEIDGFLDGTAL